jgi:hypothetical protein
MDGRVTNSRRCLEYLGRGVDASASVHIAPTCCGCPNCARQRRRTTLVNARRRSAAATLACLHFCLVLGQEGLVRRGSSRP